MAKLVHNVQKKQHRERSQTLDRSRFGLLEKKKDYRLRAADYHKKQAALKALKAKAANYNPDEYYHAMVNRKTDEDGILIAEHKRLSFTHDQVQLMKTQDVNYIRTMRMNESQKIQKERKALEFKAQGKHTVFVDSEEEQKAFKPEKFFKTDKSMLDRRENRLRIDQLEKIDKLVKQQDLDQNEQDKLDTEKLQRYRLLKERLEREHQLRQVEEEMNLQRELQKKGNKKKTVDEDGNVVFKWTNQRKK